MNLKKAQELMKKLSELDGELELREKPFLNYLIEDAEDELKFLERQDKYLVKLVEEGIRGNHFLRNIKLIQSRIKELKEIILCLKVSK